MFKDQSISTSCGLICEYCNTYYPNQTALKIHEYFHTSEEVSTLLSNLTNFNDTYQVPKAKKFLGGDNGIRVSEMRWNRTHRNSVAVNYKIKKPFQFSEDIEDLMYFTQKYPLKASVRSVRPSPYQKKTPAKLEVQAQSVAKIETRVVSIVAEKKPDTKSSTNVSNCEFETIEHLKSRESFVSDNSAIQLEKKTAVEVCKSDCSKFDLNFLNNTFVPSTKNVAIDSSYVKNASNLEIPSVRSSKGGWMHLFNAIKPGDESFANTKDLSLDSLCNRINPNENFYFVGRNCHQYDHRISSKTYFMEKCV